MNKKAFKTLKNYIILFFVLGLTSCTVKYSFSGASISPDIKTVSVQYFPTRDPLAPPSMGQRLTDDLKDKIQSQTSLNLVTSSGDVNFEGEITGYKTKPAAITADDMAAENQLTISVKVKYTNTKEPGLSFERTFSRSENYSTDMSLSDVENDGELIKTLLGQIVQDIFNAAFVNW